MKCIAFHTKMQSMWGGETTKLKRAKFAGFFRHGGRLTKCIPSFWQQDNDGLWRR